MELSLILLTFGFILSETKTVDPGVKGRVTLKGLQYAWQVDLEKIQKRLDTVHIPDFSGSVSIAVLGNVRYYITQIQIQKLDISSSDMSFSPDTGVKFSINNGQMRLTGLLRIQNLLLSASSWLELSIQGLTLDGVLGITSDDSGHGAVWNAGCASNVEHVNLLFRGGAGWFFGLFKNAIMGPMRDAIQRQICTEFSKRVQNLEKTLSKLPVSLPVDKVSSFDISLLGPPIITEKSFDLLVKGEFVGRNQHWDLPFHPGKLDLPEDDSHMLLLALSEFTANSAMFVYYKAGALRIKITDDMIPKLSPLRLNMKTLAIFVPELLSHFPDSPPLLLQVSARSAPTASCQPDSLTVQGSADIQAFVTYPNRTQIPIFQMQANSVIAVNPVVSEKTMGATISVKNFSLTLNHSSVGPVKMDDLQRMLNIGLNTMAPVVNGEGNERMRSVFPLPTPKVRLQDPVVRVQQMDDLQRMLNLGLNTMIPMLNERMRSVFRLPTPQVQLQDPVVQVQQGRVVIMADFELNLTFEY